MTIGRTVPVTPLARPVDLSASWNGSDADLAARLGPGYGQALEGVPQGPAVLRGLPFELGTRSAGNRWIVVGDGLTIALGERSAAEGPAGAGPSHLVVAHFCDSWRDPAGERPAGLPVGWVLPTGEPLARYELGFDDGSWQVLEVRRRYEVADGIIGWGFLPFAAVSHQSDEPLDWRGPFPRQGVGRYAPAGHAGPLTMLPGTWAAGQSGAVDFVPSADGDVTLWLHAIPLDRPVRPRELRMTGLGHGRPGTDVVVAGLTWFAGRASPLVPARRRQYLVTGFDGRLPAVDLGVAIRSRPTEPASVADTAALLGWGRPASAASDRATGAIVDLALAPDARVAFGDWALEASELEAGSHSEQGGRSIRQLAEPEIRLNVRVSSAGEPVPARVRFVAGDGRYLPPLGHRDEVNPAIFEDTGAGLILGADTYAYVPGAFQIDLPRGMVTVEVAKGFDHRPVRLSLAVEPGVRDLEVPLERAIDLRPAGWWTSDSHVHFLAPSTALLQAAAEDVAFVHLLATQLGDHFINVPDLTWGSQWDPSHRHAVFVGTENRQNVLGHLALLGARRPVLPLASGGAPEGRIGQEVRELLLDWAEQCHVAGGLVVGAHFPLPYAEIAADIVAGAIDAVEMQCFAPGLDNPSILEWYRFLNCGYRLPVLGGTDKMSAEVPVGAVRTYARLDPDAEPNFESWSAAVRAGRTFATSGPVIELLVEGREPGGVIELPADGGRLEVAVRARAAQPAIDALELVVNGRVVAREGAAGSTAELRLAAFVDIDRGSWIAARSLSRHQVHSAFATSMAAHTSPVYVEVVDRPQFADDDARAILAVIDGTQRWLETLAAIDDPNLRSHLVARVAASGTILRGRLGQPGHQIR